MLSCTRITTSMIRRGVAQRSFSAAPKVALPNTSALINNEWVKGAGTFQTVNPGNEEVLAEVSNSREAEVDAAVNAAQEAFYNPNSEWNQLGGYQRGVLLNRLANLIEENREELAMLEVLDNGKPFAEAYNLDLPLTIQCYRYYAGWADKIHGSVINASGFLAKSTFNYLEKEPVGVVGQIVPWNFPLLMQAWKLAPVVATGCTTVLKTAPQTPLTSNRIGELLLEAGFPAGAINILPGDDETGKLVANHDGFDKVAFTGSTAVGHKIMKIASESSNLKRVTLELGGKSALIIMEDADMDKAIHIAQVGLYLNQGQCCCASSRIFVHDSRYDEFCERIAAVSAAKPVVPGWTDAARELDPAKWPQGPQVDKTQMDKIMDLIETGKAEGASVLTGGARHGDRGFFIQPTVFADVKDDMTIAKEEIFGPVMSVLKYSEQEEVIKRANASRYGLAAAVVSENFPKARAVAKRLRAGTVWVNTYDCFDAALPFGGYKASGIGRELGEAGLDNYLEKKTMVWGQ